MAEVKDPTVSPGLLIDKELFEVRFEGTPILLTATEFDLLETLDAESHRVVPRSELKTRVWKDGEARSRVVDTFVSRLRTKLRSAGHPGIASIRKRGYRLLSPTE